MSSPAESSSVDRRLLLRGGAVLAGATVLAAAGRTPEASAADGDELLIGSDNEGATTTRLTSTGGSADATLALQNATGPTLRLLPAEDDFDDGDLQPGDIVNTDLGPVIGVDYGDGAVLDILATGTDLDLLPTPVAFLPERLLDTRTARGRESIVRSSADLRADGKVPAGQWVDVAVDAADGPYALTAVFANVTAVSPEGNGFAVVYIPDTDRPPTSTLNYRAGQNVANAVFAGLGTVESTYVIRIYTAQASHLLLDISGAVASGVGGGGTGSGPTASARKAAGGTRSGRLQRQAKQAARIKAGLRRR